MPQGTQDQKRDPNDPLGLAQQNANDPLGLAGDTAALADTGGVTLSGAMAPGAKPEPRRDAPKPKVGVGDMIRGGLRAFSAMGQPGSGFAGMAADVADIYADDRATGKVVAAPDTRDDAQKRRDAAAAVPKVRPDQSATPTKTFVQQRTGAVIPQGESERKAENLRSTMEATAKENFSPEHWAEVSKRGVELGNKLHAEGKHDEAQDVLRKAYNAQQLSLGSKTADTFGAIALTNLLGIVSDPYARQRQNIRESAQPGMTFSPEEQLDMGMRGASAERPFEVERDLAAPLVGQLPVIVAGGAAGRVAAGAVGGALERAGAQRIGQALGRLATPIEEAALVGPAAPARSAALLRTRVAEEVTQLRRNLPALVKRGATEGQIVGAVQQYQMAREQGMTAEQALAAVVESLPLNTAIGIGGETALGILGRAIGVGYDPVGRLAGEVGDRFRGRGTEVDRPVDRRADIPPDRYVGDALVGQELPAIEPRRAELAQNLDQLLAGRRGERGRELSDVFAGQDATPAGPEFWENIPPEQIPRVEPGERALGPQEGGRPATPLERPVGPLQSAEPPDRLRSARELATGEERPALQPHEEANAFVRMQQADADMQRYRSAVEAEQNDPDVVLERAAQQRPGEQQGPRTLSETLAQTEEEVRAGEPLATEYHDAINKYADAAAAIKDTETPSTQQRLKLARARRVLDEARRKYGTQFGASAVLALAANSDDLSEEEKELVGLGGLAILSTDVAKLDASHAVMQRVPFYSRLKKAVEALPKAWNEPRVAADWVGKLKGTSTFTKAELELIIPELQAAQRDKRKLSRADVQAIIDEKVPRIQRVTLAHRGSTSALEAGSNRHGYVDIDELGPQIHADDLQTQIESRNERIREIESNIESIQEEAADAMNSAERDMNRAEQKVIDRVEEAGLTHQAIRDAIEYIDEHVESEYVPRGTVAKALDEIRDNLYEASGDSREALERGGYTWELEDEPAPEYRARIRVVYDPAKAKARGEYLTMIEKGPQEKGTRDVSSDYTGRHTLDDGRVEDVWTAGTPRTEGSRPIEEYIKRAKEIYGDDATIDVLDNQAEIDAFTPDPDKQEYVVRRSDGKEVYRATDEDEAIEEAASSEDVVPDIGALIHEVESLLDDYANERANYQAKESEHYHYTEGDGAFEEEYREKDEIETEIAQIEEWINEGGGSEIMGGEPTTPEEVVDEDTPIIPEPQGKPEYASYQRIGGGTEYAELLNVIENQPADQQYTAGHYSDWVNTASHVRRETHDIRHVPGLSGKDVQFIEGEPEYHRTQKSHIIEKRKQRDKILDEMTQVAQQYEALPAIEQHATNPTERARELASKYQRLNQQVIDLNNRVEELIGTIGTQGERRRVSVMIESQSDWAQGASKYGIQRELTPEEVARNQEIEQQIVRLNALYLDQRDAYQNKEYGSAERTDAYEAMEETRAKREALQAEQRELMPHYSAVPRSPLVDTAATAQLNAARHLLDSAERGFEDVAWSDGANRIKNAHLPMQAAILQYDELTPAAMKRLLNGLGFKDVPLEKLYIKGEGHWNIRLTPEMRRAIKRAGLPILSVMALAGEAEAQDGKTKPQQADLFSTAVGGIAVGAALMYLAKNRKVRRLVKENRELERVLMLDDLSGLSNKKGFLRAKASVDQDPKFHWVVFDGDQFKAVNDKLGHAEGDKAIQHFGQVVRDASEELGIPMRGFRFGGDEIAFAAPAERAADFLKLVEERSPYTKQDVTTKLTGGMGKTFDEADAQLNATKEARRAADPSLRRGVNLYSNPIGPALRELARYPSAAGMAGVGALLTETEDEDLQKTGKAMFGLAALSAVGSRRLAMGRDKLGEVLLRQLQKTDAGTGLVRAFNPEALLSDDVKAAIQTYESGRAQATARASEMARGAQALGPEGDRAVSDVLENEEWEDVSQMPPQQMQAVLTFASQLAQEYDDISTGLVSSGAREPEELLPNYAGPRRYAYYEGQAAQEESGVRQVGQQPRVSQKKRRTLDEPIRAAEARVAEAQQANDPLQLQEAEADLDAARVEQLSKREELGEIRESSYRAAQGIERGRADIAAAELFGELRDIPGVVHPEWLAASDELDAARQMRAQAQTPADRQAAQQLMNDATVKLNDLTREAKRKGSEFVALPDSRSMGRLRGAVVQRDVANSLVGFTGKNPYLKLLRAWKEVKTVFNPGTHAANVLSNITFAHMEGLPLWEQPVWLKRAASDLGKYGPATKALAESGVLNLNAVTAEGEGVAAGDLRRQEGLEQMLGTTRPRTREVLEATGITEVGARRRVRSQVAKGAALGATLGAAKFANEENPEDSLVAGAAGAVIGGGLARGRLKLRQLYSHEDNIFRAAIWLKKVKEGMSPDDATAYTRQALGNFRTRSPAIQVLKNSVAPFILYPAKALPRFASQVVDHPWRYAALMAAWGGLNELSQNEVGETEEQDLRPGDRRPLGYALPGFTQLPFANTKGERAGVDVSRWTPLAAATTAAPPGSVPASFDETLPDIFRVAGPVTDLAARFGANVDPFSGKPAYARDYPPTENLTQLANDLAGTAMPPAFDFHAKRIREDVRNRDFDKLKNDVLGPTGLRPRFTRPGAQFREASFQLENSLREMKQDLRRSLVNNKNPVRVQLLIERHQRRVNQALKNFRERTGQDAPADLVELATSPDQ